MLIEQHMAVRTEIFIGCNAGTTNVEEAHVILLVRSSEELRGERPSVSQYAMLAQEDKPGEFLRLEGPTLGWAVL